MKKAFLVLAAAAALLSANVAFAQSGSVGACSSLATDGFQGLVNCSIGILNNLTVIIIAASVVYIVWGAFNMIRSEEKRESGRQTVIYGVIGLFAMISIWGFVNILNTTFRLNKPYNEVVPKGASNLFPSGK